jgi:hypothetical protein
MKTIYNNVPIQTLLIKLQFTDKCKILLEIKIIHVNSTRKTLGRVWVCMCKLHPKITDIVNYYINIDIIFSN